MKYVMDLKNLVRLLICEVRDVICDKSVKTFAYL